MFNHNIEGEKCFEYMYKIYCIIWCLHRAGKRKTMLLAPRVERGETFLNVLYHTHSIPA